MKLTIKRNKQIKVIANTEFKILSNILVTPLCYRFNKSKLKCIKQVLSRNTLRNTLGLRNLKLLGLKELL